jgi:DNA-binding CsgD family transcriptional regulator
MPTEKGDQQDAARLLAALQQLLMLEAMELEPALDAAAEQLAAALAADKVDVFLHEPDAKTLVAVRTVDTPMGRRQKELGLDRLALAGGGTTVQVFQTGQSKLSAHLDQEPTELRGIVEGLGVRSQIAVPITVEGKRLGVLMACSARAAFFDERDLRFAESVAHWVGLVGLRAARVERLTRRAVTESLGVATEQAVEVLTRRQREIASLIARGYSNKQIAQELVLVQGTVANHVENMLRRLGFRNRSQVAVWAVERGLYHGGEAEGG